MVHGCFKVFGFAVASVALAGCADNSSFEREPRDAYSTAGGFDDPNRQPYAQLAQAFPQQNVQGPSLTPDGSTTTNSFVGSVRKFANNLGNAVTPTPQVVPAADPTSLAGGTQNDAGADLNFHAARLYESRNRPREAAALYEKSLSMKPNHVQTLIAYARLLDREGNLPQAESLYRRAIDVDPTNPLALNDLGMLYARHGMLQLATEAIGLAIQRQPMNQRYRNNMAIVLLDAGRTEEAFGHLATVHGEANAHYNLAFMLSQREMRSEAMYHLDRALVLNPQFSAARQLAQQLAPAQHPALPGGAQYRPASGASATPGSAVGASKLRLLPPL